MGVRSEIKGILGELKGARGWHHRCCRGLVKSEIKKAHRAIRHSVKRQLAAGREPAVLRSLGYLC